jgi:hypothetical protein
MTGSWSDSLIDKKLAGCGCAHSIDACVWHDAEVSDADSSPSLRLTSGGSVTVPRLETGIAVMQQCRVTASRLSHLRFPAVTGVAGRYGLAKPQLGRKIAENRSNSP